MIVTLDAADDSGISTCAAETATDSDTALISDGIVPRSRAALAPPAVRIGGRNPSSATRTSQAPSSGDSHELSRRKRSWCGR